MTREDFDGDVRLYEDQYQEFTLRGVVFCAKPLMSGKHVSELADIETGVNTRDSWGVACDAIRETLLPEYREAWDEVLTREHKVPITLETLFQVAGYLVKGATGRPPTPLTPSGSAGVRTTTESTDESVSPAAPA